MLVALGAASVTFAATINAVLHCGATPVIVPTREEDNWLLSEDALGRAITPRTKAIILCTPSNPTGSAYPRERRTETTGLPSECTHQDGRLLRPSPAGPLAA